VLWPSWCAIVPDCAPAHAANTACSLWLLRAARPVNVLELLALHFRLSLFKLGEEVDLALLLNLKQVSALLALNEAFGRVKNLSFDYKRGLPRFHPVVLISEVCRRRPHPIYMFVVVFHVHYKLLFQTCFLLFDGLEVHLEYLGFVLFSVFEDRAFFLPELLDAVHEHSYSIELVVFLNRELNCVALSLMLHAHEGAHCQTARQVGTHVRHPDTCDTRTLPRQVDLVRCEFADGHALFGRLFLFFLLGFPIGLWSVIGGHFGEGGRLNPHAANEGGARLAVLCATR